MKYGNEWVSIGDFMAGIVGILVLFFVMAVLFTVTSQAEIEEEKQKGAREVIERLRSLVERDKNLKGIKFIPERNTMLLPDSSFAQGSACLNRNLKEYFQSNLAPQIKDELIKNQNLAIQIEGHTDIVPVHGIKAETNLCAPFDDNYTLSAGRAREARKALFSNIESTDLIKRVSVVGYGADRLANTNKPTSAENRRVEIRFINNVI